MVHAFSPLCFPNILGKTSPITFFNELILLTKMMHLCPQRQKNQRCKDRGVFGFALVHPPVFPTLKPLAVIKKKNQIKQLFSISFPACHFQKGAPTRTNRKSILCLSSKEEQSAKIRGAEHEGQLTNYSEVRAGGKGEKPTKRTTMQKIKAGDGVGLNKKST